MSIPKHIAIDGPASSGKSTLGERLAKELGYMFFDTGILYRVVTWAVILRRMDSNDEDAVTRLSEQVDIDVRPPSSPDGRREDVFLDGIDITWEIRRPEVDANVSKVSAYFGVRQALIHKQRLIGQRGNVVMVGRDIGTVVMPEAELKIYLDASVEERARRRYEEIRARGEDMGYDEILAALRQRDEYDSAREIAPLRPAKNAVILNTEKMNISTVLEKVLGMIRENENV